MSSFPAAVGGGISLTDRKVQSLLHRDVNGEKVENSTRQPPPALHSTRNAPSGPPSSSSKAQHLLPLPVSDVPLDEASPVSSRRQSSLQLSRRELAAISDDDDLPLPQFNAPRAPRSSPALPFAPSPSSARLMAAGPALDRAQTLSLSTLSPLAETQLDRTVSDVQRNFPVKPSRSLASASLSSLNPAGPSPPSVHPRLKTRAPIRSWKERPNSLQAKTELQLAASRYGSGLAGPGAEAVKARKRRMEEKDDLDRIREEAGGGGGEGRRGRVGEEATERKEPPLRFRRAGARSDEEDEAAEQSRILPFPASSSGSSSNRVLQWLGGANRQDSGTSNSASKPLFPLPTPTPDSGPVSEDDADDERNRKVRSTVDRLQASLSRGRRKVIGFPSKLREMMSASIHSRPGKGDKGEAKPREADEDSSDEREKERKDSSPPANGAIAEEADERDGADEEHRELMSTTESAMTPPAATNVASPPPSAHFSPPPSQALFSPSVSTFDPHAAGFDAASSLQVDIADLERRMSPSRSPSPPLFMPPAKRSLSGGDGRFPAQISPGHEPALGSSAASSVTSSRRSSLSEASPPPFESRPSLRGGRLVTAGKEVLRSMRSKDRFGFDREEKEREDRLEELSALKEGGKLSDLYSVQQQQLQMLEATLNEVSSNYDGLRRAFDDLQRARPRVDVDARLEALELSLEKMKASQNRNFRLIYDRLNEQSSKPQSADSTWTFDLLMVGLTWFLTGLAFVVQPISYAVSQRGALLQSLRMGGSQVRRSAAPTKRPGNANSPPPQTQTASAPAQSGGGMGSQPGRAATGSGTGTGTERGRGRGRGTGREGE